MNYAHQANESWRCRRGGLALPLKYNYATAQVHYPFRFSLPQEIKPHGTTQTEIFTLAEGL